MSNKNILSQNTLDQLFQEARTFNAWQDKAVSQEVLEQIYDLSKMAPTGVNCQPMRIFFIESAEAKAKLKPCLSDSNIEKTMQAPVTAIIAMDMEFYDHLEFLAPHIPDAKSWFEGKEKAILNTAQQNTALQAGYFIMAARAVGLDCGPMGGFNSKKVDEAFFAETSFKSTLLINLGYGDADGVYDRAPRFSFEQTCKIL